MSKSERGRFTAKRKREAVLRLLRGEDLVSRAVKVTGATLAKWREAFLEDGLGALRTRKADDRDERIVALERKLGRTVVDNELQREKIRRLEDGLPLALRRSKQ
jgi:transposase-like protein